jgi:holin-like protein
MIRGLIILLSFQGGGEIISRLLALPVPGPVIGLVLLLAFLVVRGKTDEPIAVVATALTRHLGLLFVPAAVGVVMFWPQLRLHLWAVIIALAVSVIVTIATSAGVLKFWPGKSAAGR